MIDQREKFRSRDYEKDGFLSRLNHVILSSVVLELYVSLLLNFKHSI